MAKEITMDSEARKVAQAILKVQKERGLKPTWGMSEHAAAVANRMLGIVEAECGQLDIDAESRKNLKAAMRRALIADGLGGNSSQFRQKLVKLGDLPAEAAVDGLDYD